MSRGPSLQTTVTQEVREQVRLHALREGLADSDIVRRAVLEWLSAHPVRPAVAATQPTLFEE